MKRLLAIGIMVFLIHSITYSQLQNINRRGKYAVVLDVGPKAGIGNMFIYNDNMHYDEGVKRDFLGLNYNYGGKAGISYMASTPRNMFFSVYSEYLINSFSHIYKIDDYSTPAIDDDTYTKNLDFKTKDLAFMFRLTGLLEERGVMRYIEGGIQMANFTGISESNTNTDYSGFLSETDPRYPENKFAPSYKSIVFGVGAHKMFWNIGLRLTYSLGDVMETSGVDNYIVRDGLYNMPTNPEYSNQYTNSYNPTHFFTVQLSLELNFYFLEFGTAACGRPATTPFPLFLNYDYLW